MQSVVLSACINKLAPPNSELCYTHHKIYSDNIVCYCFEFFFVVVVLVLVVKSLFGMKPKLPVRPIKFMTNVRVEENKQYRVEEFGAPRRI